MKKLLFLFLFSSIGISSIAQINAKVGVVGVYPTGNMADYFVAGIGGEASVKYVFAEKLGVGISYGFQHFFGNDWGDDYIDPGFNVVPLKGSFSYYIGASKFKPYVGVELGVNFTTLKYTYAYYYDFGGYTTYLKRDYGHTRFGFSPMVGFDLSLSNMVSIDFNVKYNSLSKVKDNPQQDASYLSACIGLSLWFGR